MMQIWFYLLDEQKNRVVFSWWPSSGTGCGRTEFPIPAGIGLVTQSVIIQCFSSLS